MRKGSFCFFIKKKHRESFHLDIYILVWVQAKSLIPTDDFIVDTYCIYLGEIYIMIFTKINCETL